MRKTLCLIVSTLMLSSAYAADNQNVNSSFIDQNWINGLIMPNAPLQTISKAYTESKDIATDDGCGCKFDLNGKIINPSECEPVYKSQDESKAKIAIVQLMDPNRWAGGLMCFRGGAPQCTDASGIAYIGETCCSKIDKTYGRIKSDLHMSIVLPQPIADEVALRTFRKVENMKPLSQSCKRILIDDETSSWFLDDMDGYIARMWLYAYKHYGAELPYVVGTIKQISETNPPEQWEFDRSSAISRLMGNRNQDVTDEYKNR